MSSSWKHTSSPVVQASENVAGIDLFDDEDAGQFSIYLRYKDGTRSPARTVMIGTPEAYSILRAWQVRGPVSDYRQMAYLWKPGSFSCKLMTLDSALTGHRDEVVHQTLRNQIQWADADYWLMPDDCYYLSDGGYSRLKFDFNDNRLFLTSNSLPKVKEAWERCPELRQDLNDAISKVLAELDG